MKKIIYFIIAACLALLLNPKDCLSLEKTEDVILRVLIADDKEAVALFLNGPYKIYAVNSERTVMEGERLSAKVIATKDGISIGKKDIKLSGVKVKLDSKSHIYLDGRSFRGDMDILKKDNGKLMIINYIALEGYLYGVLYHEVSHRWPMESLKAQAIAARTFALYQARQNKLQPYDLRSDIYSQVYGGKASEKWSTTVAVNATKGKILSYNSSLIPSYYHATCAGYTEDASNLWNIDLAPLKGVRCEFCKGSPHYRWRKIITLWELENKLKSIGYKISNIDSVTILSKNYSGRVDKLEIKDDSGVSIVMTAKDFRQMIGPNDVRSTKFDLFMKRTKVILEGLGWGHGVGMCQWGAYGMAGVGRKADEILKYYYPGTEIVTIDKVKK